MNGYMSVFIDKTQNGITRYGIATVRKGVFVHIHVIDDERALYVNAVLSLTAGFLFLVL